MAARFAYLRAVILWRRGDPVPVDVLTTLINAGYDVGVLERKAIS